MTDEEKIQKISVMCREILDSEEPFYWNYDLPEREKDLAIDFLLRAVLGFAERENGRFAAGGVSYIEEKFYSAYNKITSKDVYPD
ncbi:hypothetical protein ACFQ4Z_02930 [Oceanobacillus oncorhynchi subsp. oncorhynchi]|uniref:hypothetical protein n=1 Tax=Oceanobacillus oncorhynchi TaxID=545501 RepID=UPI0031D890EF